MRFLKKCAYTHFGDFNVCGFCELSKEYFQLLIKIAIILTNLCTEKSLRFYSLYMHLRMLMETEYLARWTLCVDTS